MRSSEQQRLGFGSRESGLYMQGAYEGIDECIQVIYTVFLKRLQSEIDLKFKWRVEICLSCEDLTVDNFVYEVFENGDFHIWIPANIILFLNQG